MIRSLLLIPEVSLLSNPAVRKYCVELDGRQSAWATLASEKQPDTLSSLLWYWLLHLEQPILGNTELSYVVVYANKPDCCLVRFDQVPFYSRFQLKVKQLDSNRRLVSQSSISCASFVDWSRLSPTPGRAFSCVLPAC